MDHYKSGTLTTICRGCGEAIECEDIVTSVAVSVWVPKLGQYRHEGPFHAECGKRYDMQAQASLKTPNIK